MKITCPWSGQEITILRVYNMDTRLWPYMGSDAVEFHVATGCLGEYRNLFYKFDEQKCHEQISPREYVHWLFLEVLKVNPNLDELVVTWREEQRAKMERSV